MTNAIDNISTKRAVVVVRTFRPLDVPSRFGAALRGWLAVRSGSDLTSYLRGRKAYYELSARPDAALLPHLVDVSSGEVVLRDNPRFRSALPELPLPVGETGVPELRALASRPEHEPSARAMQRRIAEARDELHAIDERLRTLRSQASPPSSVESAEQDLRPETGSIAGLLASTGALGALLVVEGYQFALPYFDQIGVDARALSSEWQNTPALVLSGLGFALGLTCGLYLVAAGAGSALRALASKPQALRETLWRAACAAAFGGLLLTGSWAVAGMRHGTAVASTAMSTAMGSEGGPGSTTFGFWLFTLLFMVAGELLGHAVKGAVTRRAEARAALHAWTERRRRDAERRQASAAAAQLHAEAVTQLEAAQKAGKDVLEQLVDAACAKEESVACALQDAERYAVSFSYALAACLEIDRWYFVRAACWSGRRSLVEAGALAEGSSASAALASGDDSGVRRLGVMGSDSTLGRVRED